jgi:hypothetical protein
VDIREAIVNVRTGITKNGVGFNTRAGPKATRFVKYEINPIQIALKAPNVITAEIRV